MSKSTRVNTKNQKIVRKKRPPVTGTLIGVRLQPLPLSRLDAWIAKQNEPGLGRPEAIRRSLSDLADAGGCSTLEIVRRFQEGAGHPGFPEPPPTAAPIAQKTERGL